MARRHPAFYGCHLNSRCHSPNLETMALSPEILCEVAETGNARRVVWTAAVQAGENLVAVVRDGLEQNSSSSKRVVQASNNVTCLAALVRYFGSVSLARECSDNEKPTGINGRPRPLPIALPSLSTRPIETSTNVMVLRDCGSLRGVKSTDRKNEPVS
jgi:hypothetical protein